MPIDEEEFNDFIDREAALMEIHLIAAAEKSAITLEEYIQASLLDGISPETIKQELLTDLNEGGRIFGEFRNSFKATAHGNMRRLSDIGTVSHIGTETKLRWVAVMDQNTCDSCRPRHNEIHTYSEWQELGLPRSGVLRCRSRCRCVFVDYRGAKVEPRVRERRG